jgi:hypothetical protein
MPNLRGMHITLVWVWRRVVWWTLTLQRNLRPPTTGERLLLWRQKHPVPLTKSVRIYQATRRHIPKDSNLHSHHCVNHKPHVKGTLCLLDN